jgi:hypothetical protein
MDQEPGYLVRYGLMGHVGMFRLDPATDLSLERGQAVVIHTHRGEEVGEVLTRLGVTVRSPSSSADVAASGGDAAPARGARSGLLRLLRPACAADLENAHRSARLNAERFTICQRILGQQGGPLELIDVETLLDQHTTVIHYLGPRELDLTLLRARFRTACDFDILFEPAGADPGAGWDAGRSSPASERSGRCGDCDCSGGGCGSALDGMSFALSMEDSIRAAAPAGSCGGSAHSGCSSCGIAKLRAGKRPSGH